MVYGMTGKLLALTLCTVGAFACFSRLGRHKAAKILAQRDLTSVTFSTPDKAKVECDSGPSIILSQNFNAIGPKGNPVSGVVCFGNLAGTTSEVRFAP